MTPSPDPSFPAVAAPSESRIDAGACHILFAYDIGFAIDLDHAERLITEQKHRATIRHKRRAPPSFQYQPLPLRITQSGPPLGIASTRTTDTVELVMYDFGGVSVSYVVPLR